MRILLCAQFYPPINGGEERHVRNLAQALQLRGHEVDVLTIAPGAGTARVLDDVGVRVIAVPSTAQRWPRLYSDVNRPHALPVPDPSVRAAAFDLLRSGRYDVVHAHNWIAASVFGPAARLGVPVVLTLHDYSHVCAIKRYMRSGVECQGPTASGCARCTASHYGPVGPAIAFGNWQTKKVRERSVASFIAVSSHVADRNRLSAVGAPYDVIPNFIPESLLDDVGVIETGYDAGGPLVYLGDLSKDKGVDVLLDAYGRLADVPPLLLAGRRSDARLDLPPGAQLVGELDHTGVLALMRSACCVIAPSVWPDPCPTVVLEAMALGRPVIATATGGIVDMVSDGETGYLVPAGDPGALAGAIRNLLGSPVEAARLGMQGRLAAAHFVDSRIVPTIESVYRQVVAGRKPVPLDLHHRDDEISSIQG